MPTIDEESPRWACDCQAYAISGPGADLSRLWERAASVQVLEVKRVGRLIQFTTSTEGRLHYPVFDLDGTDYHKTCKHCAACVVHIIGQWFESLSKILEGRQHERGKREDRGKRSRHRAPLDFGG